MQKYKRSVVVITFAYERVYKTVTHCHMCLNFLMNLQYEKTCLVPHKMLFSLESAIIAMTFPQQRQKLKHAKHTIFYPNPPLRTFIYISGKFGENGIDFEGTVNYFGGVV